MPVPHKIWSRELPFGAIKLETIFIKYDRFLHIIVKVNAFDNAVKENAESLVRLLGSAMDEQLIGILMYKEESAELEPLIFVTSFRQYGMGKWMWLRNSIYRLFFSMEKQNRGYDQCEAAGRHYSSFC